MTETISAQLAALPGKSTTELRAMWQELHGEPAPPFSQRYMVARLAYRVQELHFAGFGQLPAPGSMPWPMGSTPRQRGSGCPPD